MRVMQVNYIVAGFLNNATEPAKPVVELHVANDWSPEDLRNSLSDMHSKGTTLSCAVHTARLSEFLSEEQLATLGTLLVLETRMIGEAQIPPQISDLIDGLLAAGARMAQSIPDFNTLVPPLEK